MTSALDRAVHAAQVDLWRAQLVAARQLQGLSQRALATRIGVPQPRLSEWELGVYTPTVANWQAWGGALGFELQLVPTKPEIEEKGINSGGSHPLDQQEIEQLNAELAEARERAERAWAEVRRVNAEREDFRNRWTEGIRRRLADRLRVQPLLDAMRALREAESASPYLGAPSELVAFIAAADAFEAGTPAGHDYVSTACQHDLHARCRRVCKFCDVACRCDCGHPDTADQPEPVSELVRPNYPHGESQPDVADFNARAADKRVADAAQ